MPRGLDAPWAMTIVPSRPAGRRRRRSRCPSARAARAARGAAAPRPAGGAGPAQHLPQLPGARTHRPFQRLQRDVAGEAVGHDHVHRAASRSVPSYVAGERIAGLRAEAGGEQFVSPPGQLGALARLGSDGSSLPWDRGCRARSAVSHPQLGELEQHLRLGIAMAPASSRRGRGRVGSTPPGPGGADRARSVAEPARGTRRPWSRPTPRPRPGPADQLAGHGQAGAWPPQLASAPSSIAMVSSGRHLQQPKATSACQPPVTQLSGPSSQDHRGPHRRCGRRRAGHHHGRPLSPPMASTTMACSLSGRRGFSSTAPKPLTSGAVLWTKDHAVCRRRV